MAVRCVVPFGARRDGGKKPKVPRFARDDKGIRFWTARLNVVPFPRPFMRQLLGKYWISRANA
jgi:hypothetical protein